jgi:transglutaminase-like putative cysteine protease
MNSLSATPFIESEHPTIAAFVAPHCDRQGTPRERAIALFEAVRDGIRYDPYRISFTVEGLRASTTLAQGYGYCVAKAVLLAAALRASSIPARLGFSDVRNHYTSPALKRVLRTDVFAWHGHVEVQLDGRWIKATPAFDRALCERSGMRALEFDGYTDSILQQSNVEGGAQLEQVAEHGSFDDVPLDRLEAGLRTAYPHLAALLDGAGKRDTSGLFYGSKT